MKKLFTIMFVLLLSYAAKAQSKKSVSLLGGYSDNGFALMVNYHHYLEQQSPTFFEMGGYMGFLNITKDGYKMPLDIKTLQGGFLTRINPLSSISNHIVTTFGGGGVVGNEKLNNGNKELPDETIIVTEDGIIYGVYGAVETDFYLSKSISIIGRYTHFYHVNSEIKKSKFMVAIGLKYYLF